MQIRILAFILLISGLAACNASGQEDANTRNFPVKEFNRIYVEGGYRVYLYQTPEPFLRIKAPTESHIDALDVNFNENNLRLSVARRQINLSRMELHIGFKNLEELHISGGVKLSTDGYVSLDRLTVFVEGAVNGEMKMKAKTLEVISNGGSVFDLSGVADKLTVRVAGAGHVNARELTAREVVFKVEGLGFGSVNATDELDVRIEGMGKVTYVGDPNVKRVVEGLGSVTRW